MGYLQESNDVSQNIRDNIKSAQNKVTQKPECWTPGVSSKVSWETRIVPFPAAGTDTIDFYVHFAAPIRGLLWNNLNMSLSGLVAFSFVPAGVSLTAVSGTSIQSFGLFELDNQIMVLFDEDIQDVYFSVEGTGTGGTLAIMGLRGFRSAQQIA